VSDCYIKILFRDVVICYDSSRVWVRIGWAWNTGGVILARDYRSTKSNDPFQYHFMHLKSHIDWNRIETRPMNNRLSHRTVAASSYLRTAKHYYCQWRHPLGVATTPYTALARFLTTSTWSPCPSEQTCLCGFISFIRQMSEDGLPKCHDGCLPNPCILVHTDHNYRP
jgi:hypothetical protein